MNLAISIIVAIIGWIILDNTHSKPGDIIGMTMFITGLFGMLWCWLVSSHSVTHSVEEEIDND